MGDDAREKEIKALKQSRFKWKMLSLGLGVVAFLLLLSTFYFWWRSCSETAAAAPVAPAPPAAPIAPAPAAMEISPELR